MPRRIGFLIFCIAGILAISFSAYNIYFSAHLSLAAKSTCSENCTQTSATRILPPTLTPTATTQSTALAGYTLTWDDEFQGHQLDSSKWYAVNNLGGNQQQGCCLGYTYSSVISPNQLHVHDGMLTITTNRNATNGKAYATGAITTETLSDTPTFTFTYGRIDIRAKLPAGKGVWPAMWLLTAPATTQVADEIDMMEMLGQDPHTFYTVNHYTGGRDYCSFTGPDYSQGFHVFSLDWEPNKLTWSVDGQVVCSATHHVPNQPMYLIINTAISNGQWGNPVNASTPLPQTFDINYVRVYKQK